MSNDLAFLLELPVEVADMRRDVIEGLSQKQKSIPPKYFYDDTGADLFVQITQTPEYYPTRAETALLNLHRAEIAEWAGPHASILEPGSGAADKVQLLLAAMDAPHECILLDISAEQLRDSGAQLSASFPNLRVGAVSGDFTAAMPDPENIFTGRGKRICFFPGSTIGNFAPTRQAELLTSFKSVLRSGDAILLGADGVKDTARLDAAYNDAAGVTARFNLNLLTRLQNELGAQLHSGDFQHQAFFNPDLKRIEMHLVAPFGAKIIIDNKVFKLSPGETIHTENSWKFDHSGLESLASRAGLNLARIWQPAAHPFYLVLLEVP